MISDSELLKLVMDRYPEQPMTFVLEQFAAFKSGLIQANNKLASLGVEEIADSEHATEMPAVEAPAPKKKYTRRNLVVKPEEAIAEQSVRCCICGKTFQNLTAKHLLTHGITVEEYKKLCGYHSEQKLICSNLLEKLQENVLKAQRSRERKLTGEHLK